MTPDAAIPPTAARLVVDAPGDPVFLPLIRTSARIFTGSLPDARELVGQVEQGLATAFDRAASAGSGSVSVTLLYVPPTLEVTVAPAGGKPVVIRFTTGSATA